MKRDWDLFWKSSSCFLVLHQHLPGLLGRQVNPIEDVHELGQGKDIIMAGVGKVVRDRVRAHQLDTRRLCRVLQTSRHTHSLEPTNTLVDSIIKD